MVILKEIQIGKNEANQRVDKFLKKFLPKAPLSFIYKMIRKKNIKVNKLRVDNTYILQENDEIQIYINDDTMVAYREEKKILPININFTVIYEDENILLVGKPRGLLVHGDAHEKNNTLINQVLKYLYDRGEYNPSFEKTFVPASANRLDRNTSGIIIVGKNNLAVQNLNEMIRNYHNIRKYYLALIFGKFTKERTLEGRLLKDRALNKVILAEEEDAKEIKTIVRPRKIFKDYSLVEVELITGRSHQIRLHLASIGHPIVGDSKYGDNNINRQLKNDFGFENQFLHAYKLHFEHCIGSLKYLEGKSFVCPLPKELIKIEEAVTAF